MDEQVIADAIVAALGTQAGMLFSERNARIAARAAHSVMAGKIAELDAEVERLTPRYAQPCFDHEYITTGCPDCGKLA